MHSPKQTQTNIGTPTKQGSSRMSPTLGSSSGSTDSFSDRQFIAITSEKTARVIALPSQNCVYRQQIADTDYVVKAEIISLKGNVVLSKRHKMQRKCHFMSSPKIVYSLFDMFFSLLSQFRFRCGYADSVCLICYISTGHLIAYSLPSLRQLMDVDFLPLADLRYILCLLKQQTNQIHSVLL